MEPYRNYGRMQCRQSPCDTGNRVQNNKCNPPAKCDFSAMKMPLAMGFVHMQEWEELYSPDDALMNGTAFPSLNLIFCGIRGRK